MFRRVPQLQRLPWSVIKTFVADLVIVFALLLVFALVYNTVPFPPTWEPLRKQTGFNTIEFLAAFAALAVAFYAYKTINQMVRDRRKDTVEKKLQKVYSPIFETLLEARERGRRNHDPPTWDLSVQELERIKEIIRDYGHYFETKEDLDTFRKTLLGKGRKEPKHGNSWLFEETDMGPVFEKIIEKRKEYLTREFRELTKPP